MTDVPCTTAWCCAHEPVGDNGEPTHTSRTLTVTVADGGDGYRPRREQLDLLRAELFLDEYFVEHSAAVWISSGRADDLTLGRAQAEKLDADLETFARDLRDLCRQLPEETA